MTLFECIQSFLSANVTLAAKVPSGFRPQVIPQGIAFPLVVIRIVSGVSDPPTHDSGVSRFTDTRLEITAWGGGVIICEQISLAVENMFKGFTGYLGGSGNGLFSVNKVLGPRSLQDELTREFGVQIDVIGRLDRSTLA